MIKPLEDILVVDFSQFLSGPSASLRLADLGARVIKVEKPGTGDICRQLYVSNLIMNGDSSVFHAINRNKESFVADLKKEVDRNEVWELVKQADVVMHNFRPGVMERLGFDFEAVKQVNPGVVYGEISGYGDEGPWRDKPGQDLLVQSLSGLTGLSGNGDKGPVPMGIAVVDILTGAHLAQGLMACLVRKGISGTGGLVQVSMMESIVDFQFEVITTYFRDGGEPTVRSLKNNAHAYLGAPYGIYRTNSGYLAIAMASIPQLGELLDCPPLLEYQELASWFDKRDEIKSILAAHLLKKNTDEWLAILEPADVWCSDVLTWDKLMKHEGFKVLDMIQEVSMGDGYRYRTTRCPIRIDGEYLLSKKGAPKLGEHTAAIIEEMLVKHATGK
ncbi:CaiB/BaiF CoA transferase family protein [Pontibacter beigongshangensis]|uniref:CaiB/BaiF CoA transferase family protein n=1 Tax=Pontibacter beigongshangensis TaxID=2574733 RepID=UPI001887D7F2|nr:CaiB/BaiF CoA-transferase family protein [Pontibacter beigongshangensis]